MRALGSLRFFFTLVIARLTDEASEAIRIVRLLTLSDSNGSKQFCSSWLAAVAFAVTVAVVFAIDVAIDVGVAVVLSVVQSVPQMTKKTNCTAKKL